MGQQGYCKQYPHTLLLRQCISNQKLISFKAGKAQNKHQTQQYKGNTRVRVKGEDD